MPPILEQVEEQIVLVAVCSPVTTSQSRSILAGPLLAYFHHAQWAPCRHPSVKSVQIGKEGNNFQFNLANCNYVIYVPKIFKLPLCHGQFANPSIQPRPDLTAHSSTLPVIFPTLRY
jgi:hypothetical protein